MGVVGKIKEIACTKYGRIIIDFAILILLALVIFRNFLFTNEWPGGGDVLGMISRAYLFGRDFRWLYVWRPQSFGFVEGINLLDFFLMLIYLVFRDPSNTTKILLFSSFLMAGFSMYAFAYRYTRQHLAALSASLIYTLNQWFFTQFTEAHGDITFSYALAPLLFLLLDKALETRKSRDVLALALGLFVFVSGFHPQCIVIYGTFLAIFIVFYILLPTKSDNFRARIKRLVKISLPVGVISCLLAAFSLVPFILNVRAYYYSPAYTYPLEAFLGGTYKNVTDAFTLSAIEQWGYIFAVDMPIGLSLPDFPVSTLLLCLFSLAYCTMFLRRDRYTVFFAVSALISIFISKGPHPPFGYIFVWSWFNVPHFAIFRAASRWIMMAAFSHSFFVSVLVSIITNYAKKRRHLKIGEVLLRMKEKVSERTPSKEVYVSFDMLNNFVRGLHRSLYYFSIIILIFIFLSGFFSCFFFISQGLQVYTPPPTYLEPLEWIAEQPRDYRIVTVSRSPSEWRGERWAGSDFAFVAMLTELGWGHDIGYDSSFIHDKPTLQNGGWEPLSRAFVDHLRFRLVHFPEYMTDDALKMLGTFDYKYIVLPPYASASMRNFFLNQQGAHIIHNQSGSLIIENHYHTPRIFVTTEHSVVVGGLESFASLCKIDSFNLNQTALIFAHQIDKSLLTHTSLSSPKALIFVNSDILDIVMLSLKDDVNLIKAAEYGVSSQNYTQYWIRSPSWRQVGGLALSGDTLTTLGKSNVNIPFRVESEGTYDIWIRVGFAGGRGKLSVSIDGILGGEIQPYSRFWSGLRWVNVTRLDLRSGDHVITLANDGTGYNDMDAIAIVKPSQFRSKMEDVINALQGFSGRLIYVLEAESAFAFDLPTRLYIAQRPYQGFVLESKKGYNVSPKGNASASSVAFGLEAKEANDGNLKTRWSSSNGLPQWLQIEWPTPQELVGVRIVFEHAYARNYIIQTWNGGNWVDQVSVERNRNYTRVHEFPQPVQTTKLRIYVTVAPDYNMVSIWELEAYATQAISTSTRIFVPREGNYILAARLASGPDYGTLNVTINNVTTPISCFDSNEEFKWYESEPIFLNAGEQTLSVTAVGKVDIDEIILYSLKDGESAVPLNHLFKSSTAPPSISYEKVNPCKYRVHVKSSEPFLLIFSDSYHPLWRAYIDNVEVSPVIAYSLVNGFFINKTGEFDITLYFTGQTYADIGLKISTITLIAVVACLATPPRIFRKAKEWILKKAQDFLKERHH